MKLRTLTTLIIGTALAAGSMTAIAKSHPQRISKSKAISIAKARTGGGRVTDVDHSDGRWEIEIRKGCTEYDIDVSSSTGRIENVDTENRCDDE